jgi:hypothetical protein
MMRSLFLMLLAAATTTRGLALQLSPAPQLAVSRANGFTSYSAPAVCRGSVGRSRPLFLSDATEEQELPEEPVTEADLKTKLAMDLRRLFDMDEMGYTVMVREENKGVDGKLTPDELIAAIQKDAMFGEDFEEYCEKHASDGDVKILDIGKFSDDMESSAPLPEEDNLTIPGKGSYLVHLSFAEGILATMRVKVD